MRCGSNYDTNNCVCDTLLAIAEAQDKISQPEGCVSGCGTSIDELTGGLPIVNNFNTVPVLLTCKGTCDLFVGTGARRANTDDIDIVESVAFRVVDVDPETCCATLEFLQEGDVGATPAELLGAITTANDLTRTGICITTDLNNFSTASCLPAVNLPPATA